MKKFLAVVIGVFALTIPSLAAGSATISASPSSATKTVNQVFDISIRVSGSTNFSTFKGNVSLTNLTVVGFTLNASNVIWMSQPSAGSLNFNAAVKGTTGVSSITVYTIRVKAPSVGTARVSISGGRVVGTDPVEDLSVGYVSGTYTITAPPPTATRAPQPTSAPVTPSLTFTPTVTVTIDPNITVSPTPTPTLSPEQLTTLTVSTPDGTILSNYEIYIDNNTYQTDNTGNVTLPALSEGTHEIKYYIDGQEYKYPLVLGIGTGGKEILIQFVNTPGTSAFTLGNFLILGGVLLLINSAVLYLIYRKTNKNETKE